MKKEAENWFYDGRYDFATLSGTNLWCSINPIRSDTIFDRITGSIFFIDKDRNTIIGFDKFGKVLWTTNPRLEIDSFANGVFKDYRTDNPYIDYFSFIREWGEKTLSKIRIGYNNSQFGNINQETGFFEFGGQD